MGFALLMGPANVTHAATGLNVASHTQDEIRNHVGQSESTVTFKTEPVLTAPYSAGAVSDAAEKEALDRLNLIRYIAGLPDNVTLDQDYINMVQAGALVNCANGELTHYPTQPAGMSDSLFQLGKTGCGSSNIAWGYGLNDYYKLPWTITHSWMADEDEYNFDRCGHRRWILNPKMAKTGFGCAYASGKGVYSSMYSFDSSGTSTCTNVAWPAQNMPVEYFDASYPWSLSVGKSVSNVTVTLKRRKDNKTWTFNSSSSASEFSVNNDYYGQPGCVIFRPSDVGSYSVGDVFDVTIKGTNVDVAYTVNFFSLKSTHVHSLTHVAAVPATCTAAGTKEYWICYGCNKMFANSTATTDVTTNFNTWKVVAAKGHSLTKTAEVSANCKQAGTKAYWTCSRCSKKFADANGTTDVTSNFDTWKIIPISGHGLTHVAAVSATCTTAGTKEYWTCSGCNKKFADASGTTDVTSNFDTWKVVAAKGHSLTKTAAVAATCTKAGTKAYWSCSGCSKKYADANGTTDVTSNFNTWKVVAAKGHNMTKTAAVAATCTKTGTKEYWTCSNCNKKYADANGTTDVTSSFDTWKVVAMKPHTEVSVAKKKATFEADGCSTGTKCSVCGTVLSGCKKIYRIASVELDKTSYVYDGEIKNPSLIIKNSNGGVISSGNYTVEKSSGRKNVGRYQYKVTFKTNYSGSQIVKFSVCPMPTTLLTPVAQSKAIEVKWKRQATKMSTNYITGYQIRWSTSNKMTNCKSKSIPDYKKVSQIVSGLEGNQKYYVQVRTYMMIGDQKFYSPWSDYRIVVTKP